MAVSTDIVQAWRRPRQVMRRHLKAGLREDRALAFLMSACFLIFIGQLPYQARLAQLDGSIPLDARLQSTFYGWLLLVPIFAYVLALVIFWVIRVFTSKTSAYTVRLALFWSLLALSPAVLFFGLCRGFLGDGPGTSLAGVVVVGGFFWILIQSFRETISGATDV